MNYFRHSIASLVTLAVLSFAASGWTQTYKVLHNLGGPGDGANSQAGLTFDSQGNLYGTTWFGGNNTCQYGCGTVFELTPGAGGSWSEKVIYQFTGGTDGSAPGAQVVFDSHGNLFGTAAENGGGFNYNGTVFELTPAANGTWNELTLHRFLTNDGDQPRARVTMDSAGRLYSTTFEGGAYGRGVVFSIGRGTALNWYELVLHSFGLDSDGTNPYSDLVPDGHGGFYGTTSTGGAGGLGTVFELTPNSGGAGWRETIIHSFSSSGVGTDGASPYDGVLLDSSGNLYGATAWGGSHNLGNIFELTKNADGTWSETILYNFTGGTDQGHPGGLVFDPAGNLYGVTGGSATNFGTIFKLAPSGGGHWQLTTLYTFTGGSDGYFPTTPLIIDSAGNLYGTTAAGGAYHGYNDDTGVVFELTP
jgi:uncharacterized repeat protein (TIGR03803 family)